MSKLIVFMSKAPIGERSHKVYVTNFDSIEDFHQQTQNTIMEAQSHSAKPRSDEMGLSLPLGSKAQTQGEKEDHPFPDLTTFTQMLEKLPVNLSTPDDTPNITIEAVLKFDNIPPGRDLIEVISAIYYVCSQHGLVDGVEIKHGQCTMDVLSNPEEILDPKTFDWNIPKLINEYMQVLWLTTFMDFKPDGSPYPDNLAGGGAGEDIVRKEEVTVA